MPVATQKTDTGLSMGLLKILHKQVSINYNIRFYETKAVKKQLVEYENQFPIVLCDKTLLSQIPSIYFFSLINSASCVLSKTIGIIHLLF